MRFHLIGAVVLAVFCAGVTGAAVVRNICEDSQLFNFDNKKVNSVYISDQSFVFATIRNLRINENYEFETWICPAINTTMTAQDVLLYNHHLLKIYSKSFFEGDINDFYLYRNYIKNIRDSFIETKKLAENPENIEDCRTYLATLKNIIERTSDGYRFIDALTTIKESKLTPYVLSVDNLKNEIDGLSNIEIRAMLFSFKNKILETYYQYPLLMQSRFVMSEPSKRYLSLDSYATVYTQLFIPLHDPNYDPNKNCLRLKDLPPFFHSL